MFVLAWLASAQAAVVPVGPLQTHTTIQQGVDAALDGDTLLVDPGIYPGSVDLTDRILTIVSVGGAASTTIGPGSGDEVILVDDGDLHLEGFTVDGGGSRIGVDVFSGTLTVVDSVITNGDSDADGGGIRAKVDAIVDVQGCEFSFNHADDQGGAIMADVAVVTIDDSIFHDNDAATGGAISIDRYGSLVLTNSTVTNNTAVNLGGGLSLEGFGFTLTATNVEFGFNTAESLLDTGRGGGVYAEGFGSIATFDDCDIHDNFADSGGGMAVENGADITVTNAPFSDNIADWDGGGLSLLEDSDDGYPTTLSLTACTFSDNIAGQDGGGFHGRDESDDGIPTALDIIGGSFVRNAADMGGAISFLNLVLTVDGVTFSDNTAVNQGTAIRTDSTVDDRSELHVVASLFERNGINLWYGAILDIFDSTFVDSVGYPVSTTYADSVELRRNQFCGNRSFNFSNATQLTVYNNVFADDKDTHQQVHLNGFDAAMRMDLFNNHFVGVGLSFPNLFDPVPDSVVNNVFAFIHDDPNSGLRLTSDPDILAYNLVYDIKGELDWPGTQTLWDDPLLLGYQPGNCDLANMVPGAGSPLIDGGDPALYDLDGSRSDIGAFGGPDPIAVFDTDADGDGIRAIEDCDDNASLVGASTLWFPDNDGDGLGGLIAVYSCAPAGVAVGGDCDDDDPAIGGPPTWYYDEDGDGFGVGAPIVTCIPRTYLAPVAGDCDDGDAFLNPNTIWYADVDGDSYGDPADTMVQCVQPAGYIADDSDCDDMDPLVTVSTDWFPDIDGDGFGDTNLPTNACLPPFNHVADGTDCDDGNAQVHPNTSWYPDIDGDGYGDDFAPAVVVCSPPANHVLIRGDCDDANIAVNPNTTWYLDADGDGFGDPAVSQVQCAQPPGYVLDDTDCDDGDAIARPDAVWHRDLDSDGFGDPNVFVFACVQPSGYVADGTDCDDITAFINPNTVWFIDADGDGYGDDTQPGIVGCDVPGRAWIGGDCDDTDATIGGEAFWYNDTDGDGWGDDATGMVQCEPADGVLVGGDCDDTDPDQHPGQIWYPDADGDGFGQDDVLGLTSCAQPSGYVLDNTDCDDTDAARNPSAEWYPDADGDGFGDESAEPELSCRPVPDKIMGGGDCDDTDPAVNVLVWNADRDGDGYGDPGDSSVTCQPPSGYIDDDTDCDDTDPLVHPATTWYGDADGDGHGDPATTEVTCDPGVGWALTPDDCDDLDPEVNLTCAGDDGESEKAGSGCGCSTGGEIPAFSWLLVGLLALRRRDW